MHNMTVSLNSNSEDVEYNPDGTRAKTDWKSIYILSLVTFLGAIQAGAVGPTVWPYMKLMDPSVPDVYSGYFRSLNSFGHVISAILSGYLVNRLNQTKTPMVTGKILVLVASFIYLTIELLTTARRYVFIIFEFLMGFSMGFLMIGRVYVAMASTEKDRSKAVSTSSLSMPFGSALGPLFQIFFTLFGYPGQEFLFGTHINIYTAPIYLSIIGCVIGIALLLLFFNGLLHNNTKADNTSISSSSGNRWGVDLDKIAILVCLLTRLIVGFVMICMMAIGPPYTMTIFEWTSAKAVLYNSITQGLIGAIGICWNFVYMFTTLNHRLSERKAILMGFLCFITFFLITYPWPMYTERIKYHSIINNGTEPTGCNRDYEWCADTPAVNVWVYNIAQVLCMGFGMPLITINLDIIYSKILGPIKQGTMQGVFMFCGEILNIAGPVIMTNIYVSTGPRYIWLTEIGVIIFGVILWLVFFKRMISYFKKSAEAQQS